MRPACCPLRVHRRSGCSPIPPPRLSVSSPSTSAHLLPARQCCCRGVCPRGEGTGSTAHVRTRRHWHCLGAVDRPTQCCLLASELVSGHRDDLEPPHLTSTGPSFLLARRSLRCVRLRSAVTLGIWASSRCPRAHARHRRRARGRARAHGRLIGRWRRGLRTHWCRASHHGCRRTPPHPSSERSSTSSLCSSRCSHTGPCRTPRQAWRSHAPPSHRGFQPMSEQLPDCFLVVRPLSTGGQLPASAPRPWPACDQQWWWQGRCGKGGAGGVKRSSGGVVHLDHTVFRTGVNAHRHGAAEAAVAGGA